MESYNVEKLGSNDKKLASTVRSSTASHHSPSGVFECLVQTPGGHSKNAYSS